MTESSGVITLVLSSRPPIPVFYNGYVYHLFFGKIFDTMATVSSKREVRYPDRPVSNGFR